MIYVNTKEDREDALEKISTYQHIDFKQLYKILEDS